MVGAELPAAKTTDSYLGLLYAMEDYAVCVTAVSGGGEER